MKDEGVIRKALSGFYYVQCGEDLVTCRARGKFRYQKITPLVGDRVVITRQSDGTGSLTEILPRRNAFQRPAVANIDQMVIIASGAIPVSDPFLLDRIISLAEGKGCEPILCINKWDLVPATDLLELYQGAGIPTLAVSAKTGQGLEELRGMLAGKLSAFTGNSGVGKSSILNALDPAFGLATGEISEKLGRGRHTTRHVELFPVAGGLIADTPGFSAFDHEKGGQAHGQGHPGRDLPGVPPLPGAVPLRGLCPREGGRLRRPGRGGGGEDLPQPPSKLRPPL